MVDPNGQTPRARRRAPPVDERLHRCCDNGGRGHRRPFDGTDDLRDAALPPAAPNLHPNSSHPTFGVRGAEHRQP